MWILLLSRRASPLVFDRTQNNQALHVETAAGRSSAIGRRMSANRLRRSGQLTTFAPILMSFSFRVVSDQSLIGSGVARVRRKLPRL
jgi:hypothetical protein